jgi:hypothetical protein
MVLIDHEGRPVSTGQALGRGFTAANGALLGAVYLALLHAPLQVTNAIWQSVPGSTFAPNGSRTPGELPSPWRSPA